MATSLRCVVLATADRALPSLQALREAGHEIVRIIACPRSSGAPPILPEDATGTALEQWAKDQGIVFRRPANPAGEEFRAKLAELEPDLGILVAFGRRLPPSLLGIPEKGWVKAHYSLLPKDRGLHPLRSALWNGRSKTGVSLIEVTESPDAGPILDQEIVDIEPSETMGELSVRLAPIGAEVLASAVDDLANGRKLKRRQQNEKAATATPRFGSRHLSAPWWREAKVVFNHLRALSPEPGMRTMIRRRRVGIVWGEPMQLANAPFGECGTYVGIRSGRLAVLCANQTVFGIHRLRWRDGTPVSPGELVRELGLDVGRAFI